MRDKEAIKKEIERLKNRDGYAFFQNETADIYYARGVRFTCENLISFIDSLPEEPVSEDLEEASDEYTSKVIERTDIPILGKEVAVAFKAGAEWQKEKTVNKVCEWMFKQNFSEKYIENFKEAMED